MAERESASLKPNRGRPIAFAAAVVALAVTALALWRPLNDEWLIWRLRKGDDASAAEAAARLAAGECFRAIPALVTRLTRTFREPLWGVVNVDTADDPDALHAQALARAFRRLWLPGAVPHLVQVLEDGESAEKLCCLEALRLLAPAGPMATRAVHAAMQDPDEEVRIQALRTLAILGSADVAGLVRFLEDPSGRVGLEACRTLAILAPGLGPTVKGLRSRLSEGSRDVEIAAYEARTWALAAMVGEGVDVVPDLVALLRDPDPHTARWAALHLASMGPEAHAAVPVLARFLEELGDDPEADVDVLDAMRGALAAGVGPGDLEALPGILSAPPGVGNEGWIATAARGIGPGAIPELLRAVEGPDPVRATNAIGALGALGPEAGEAVPALARLLEDEVSKDTGYRQAGLEALASLDASAAPALPGILAALRRGIPYEVIPAAKAAANIGLAASEAVPHLRQLLVDSEVWGTRIWTAAALLRLDAEDVERRDSLVKFLQSASVASSLEEVIEALGWLGPSCGLTEAELGGFFFRDGRTCCPSGLDIEAFLRLGPPGRSVLERLLSEQVAASELEDDILELAADERIGRAPELRAPLAAVIERASATLGSPDDPGRTAELEDALVRVHPDTDGAGAAATVSSLIDGLRDPSPGTRAHAAERLGRLGIAARRAIPALLDVVRDDEEEPALIAAWAIDRIRISRAGRKAYVDRWIRELEPHAPYLLGC